MMRGYLVAVGAPAMALLACLALSPWLDGAAALLLYCLAVLVTAGRFGMRPGLTAAAMGAVGAPFLLSGDTTGAVHLVLYAATAVGICLACGSLHAARHRVEAALGRARDQARERRKALDQLREDEERFRLAANRDAAARKKAEALLAGQNLVLERIATDAPLADVLGLVCRAVEEQYPDLLCSVVQLGPGGRHLHVAAGPSLPEAYRQALDGLHIDPPYLGPCGMALDTGQPVVVTDVDTDDRWPGRWRDLARGHGLRACRTTPVVAVDGTVLGAFAVYGRQPGDPAGEAARVVAIAIHLARIAIDRERRKDALRESEERLRRALTAAGMVAWEWDPVTDQSALSENASDVFGAPAPVSLDQAFARVHPDDAARVRATVLDAVHGTDGFRLEFRVTRSDTGELVWVEDRGYAVREGLGGPVRLAGILVDVTGRKRAEDALKDADRRKDEFLATLAHELRNPLAPIRNGLQVLKLAGATQAAAATAREMVERQLGHMVRLIDDLLDVSRISRGKVTLRKGRIDLGAVVRQAVETSRPLLDQAGHALALAVPGDPVWVDGDLDRLAQVFANLLNNAAKYTEPDGRIALAVTRDGSDAVVRVTDNGVGIPADMLPRVFDLFTQVDRSLDRAQGGLGIGLSLVRGLVELHGGSVAACSDGHGLGSEFVVRLPLWTADDESRLEESRAGSPLVLPHPTLKILVADDNRDAADSLAMLLDLLGYETRTAHDGLAAVEAAAAFGPDVVLLDIGMPKLNGYDACRRIRQEAWGRDVVLVALTGWGQEEDRRRSREAGFDHHLVKPADPAALQKLLAGVPARKVLAMSEAAG